LLLDIVFSLIKINAPPVYGAVFHVSGTVLQASGAALQASGTVLQASGAAP
jgi:hypothetical protein